MADPRGFLKVRERELPPNRPVEVRLRDWRDVHEHLVEGQPLWQNGMPQSMQRPACSRRNG